jgi:hypothetical protein
MKLYVIWLLQAPAGRIERIPAEVGLGQFLDTMSRTMPRIDVKDIDVTADRLAEIGVKSATDSIGLIDRDEHGVYMAMLGTYATKTRGAVQVAGVYGVTLVEHRAFTFNQFGPFEGRKTYDAMLETVKSVVAETNRINGGDEGAWGWPDVDGKLAAGAVALLAILGVAWGVLRWKRNSVARS